MTYKGFTSLAEEVRFELTVPCGTPVFKTGAIDHSATLPSIYRLQQGCIARPCFCASKSLF